MATWLSGPFVVLSTGVLTWYAQIPLLPIGLAYLPTAIADALRQGNVYRWIRIRFGLSASSAIALSIVVFIERTRLPLLAILFGVLAIFSALISSAINAIVWHDSPGSDFLAE